MEGIREIDQAKEALADFDQVIEGERENRCKPRCLPVRRGTD